MHVDVLEQPVSRNAKQNCLITAIEVEGGTSWNFTPYSNFCGIQLCSKMLN